jgi:phosphatidylethanolamine/phosphatidyl-N-methylethanolamine N-methyltransferase
MTKETIEFVKAAIRDPLGVSTVFPTSRHLAETLLDHTDLKRSRRVVELGAGTGAITKHLAPRLPQESDFLGIELDDKMVEFLKQEFPHLRFETGLAEELPKWVAPESVDVIVSSLPWTVFNEDTQQRTVEALEKSLKPGGAFVTYICANALIYPSAKSFISKLKTTFRDVHKSQLVWRNIPPAFVFRAVK